jgi:hypothetical protein
MDWQGIPFKLINTDSIQNTFLNVSHIPDIVLQTGFSWDSLISGLIAGAIPAIVAVVAMIINSRNTQAERKHQLDLANKNINMQITSASRQVWINELREAGAKYLGALTTAINSYNLDVYERSRETKNSESYYRYFNENLTAMNELAMLTAKITLLLNPNEDEAIKVIGALNKIKRFLTMDRDDQTQINFEDIDPLRDELRDCIYTVIKKEWEKLKGTEG